MERPKEEEEEEAEEDWSQHSLRRYNTLLVCRYKTDVGRFHSSMHKWGLALSPNCECDASGQTADHVLTGCPIHWHHMKYEV